MKQIIKTFFKDILTEISGEYDAARVSLLIALLSFIVYAFCGLFFDHQFDLVSFGIAITGIITGGTAGIGFRAKLEDNQKSKI